MRYRLQDLRHGFEVTSDVVVVGSGPGGAIAASNLANAGFETVLLEAGPEVAREDMFGEAPRFLARFFWDGGLRIIGGSAQIPSLQGRCLGGSSVMNSAIMFRLPDWVRQEWRIKNGLSFLSGEALDEAYDRVFAKTRVTRTPASALGRRNEVVRDALQAAGLEGEPLPRAIHECEGRGDCLTGCTEGHKQSVDRSVLPEAEAAGAKIFTCSVVERVLFEHGRACGVVGYIMDPRSHETHSRFVVRAPRVILSAGAVQTPVILQQSHVFGGGRVGGSFFAHLGAGVLALMEDDVEPWFGATQGWGAFSNTIQGMKFESLWAPPSLLFMRYGGFGLRYFEALREARRAVIVALVYRARMKGSVRAGLGGRPRIRLWIDPAEVSVVLRGMQQAAEALFKVGARHVFTGLPHVPEPLQNAAQTRALLDPHVRIHIRDLPTTANHIFGSCPMHTSPERGVVDAGGRVHGIEGLYVADASVFPSPSAVNPQATIMALSDLISRRIAVH